MMRKLGRTAAAAAVALALTVVRGSAMGGSDADAKSTYHDLSRVSAASPFQADCNGPDFPITAAYVNAESEPYVAVNPRNPRNLIAVYHEDRFPNDGANGVLAATSFDGGRTWQVPALSNQPKFSRCAGGDEVHGGAFEKASDPWVAFAPDGTAYFAAVAWNASNPDTAQFVSVSTDGGRTWNRPVAALHANDRDVSNASRPVVTPDPTRGKTAYLVWARQRSAPAAEIRGAAAFSRTTDGGRTWSPARAIYTTPIGMQTSANQIVVTSNGDLVNVFNELRAGAGSDHPRHDRIAVIRSTDGGLTWSTPVTLATSDVIGVADPRTGTMVRVGDSFTDIAVDPRPGTNTIYAVWGDARFSGGRTQQVAFARSTDGGLTWSAPMAVSTDRETQTFIPSVAVNDRGDVAVTYYGFAAGRAATRALMTSYWITVSQDQGRTWTARQLVTSHPFDLRTAPFNSGFFLGEYQGLAGAGPSFVAAVTLTNGHDLDNRTDIYSCTVTPGVPAASAAGTSTTATACAGLDVGQHRH